MSRQSEGQNFAATRSPALTIPLPAYLIKHVTSSDEPFAGCLRLPFLVKRLRTMTMGWRYVHLPCFCGRFLGSILHGMAGGESYIWCQFVHMFVHMYIRQLQSRTKYEHFDWFSDLQIVLMWHWHAQFAERYPYSYIHSKCYSVLQAR